MCLTLHPSLKDYSQSRYLRGCKRTGKCYLKMTFVPPVLGQVHNDAEVSIGKGLKRIIVGVQASDIITTTASFSYDFFWEPNTHQ